MMANGICSTILMDGSEDAKNFEHEMPRTLNMR
jgi:hypothetical protein